MIKETACPCLIEEAKLGAVDTTNTADTAPTLQKVH
jgi:hypothetical protein